MRIYHKCLGQDEDRELTVNSLLECPVLGSQLSAFICLHFVPGCFVGNCRRACLVLWLSHESLQLVVPEVSSVIDLRLYLLYGKLVFR